MTNDQSSPCSTIHRATWKQWVAATLICVAAASASAQAPVGTAFTYQGTLRLGGNAVTVSTDFKFRLFDALTGGSQINGELPATLTPDSDGGFSVDLDFGTTAFTGSARFVEIDVRSPAGSGTFTTLVPRQEIKPTPYALFALSGNTGPAGPQGPVGQQAQQAQPVPLARPGLQDHKVRKATRAQLAPLARRVPSVRRGR